LTEELPFGPDRPAGAAKDSLKRLGREHPWLYEQIFFTAADALIVVDSEGRLQLANRQCERLFGYDSHELLALTIEDLIPARFRESHRRYRTHYGRKPESRPMGMNLSLQALHRNGHEFPVEISLSPFPFAGETLICANVRDVSELQRARALAGYARQTTAIAEFGRLALSSKDLEAMQREACRLAIQHLGAEQALVVRRESKGHPPSVTASMGFDPQQLALVSAGIARRCQPETMPLHEPLVLELADSTGPSDAPWQDEGAAGLLMLCAIPGEEHSVGVLGVGFAAAPDAAGARGPASRAFTRDDANFLQSLANALGAVLQRERTEERLFQSQRLEALGQLTGGVAHDFNNLLTIVSGNLQMLEEHLEEPLYGKLVKTALRATSRGADLTRKLLAFSRRQALQPRAVEVGPLLASLAEMLRRTLGARIEVRLVLEDHLPAVTADPGMLDTALLNLAVNARDAMPEGGQLTLEAHRESLDADYAAREAEVTPGEYVQIAVSDDGAGMPPEVLGRAFEPFFTTKDSSKGSGLGLSLVYGFVKQSGGHIKAYSEPGLGTTIKLYLPTVVDASLPPAPVVDATIRGGDETILVVEDDDEVRAVAVGFLDRLGYRVLQAGDAPTALEQLERHRDIALLFTDVVLRGEANGPDLAREARRRYPGLEVLFTSGYARNALPARSELDGPIELLGKPYPMGELARLLRRALDGKPKAPPEKAGA
jgi:PAS domain S-box-containing protein